ncbi:hypothetical protein EV383_6099 [Pseudonocardia sediminis]|uniref:Uncharacterized protein n=1 Tax=Pseudonocardia sediminis TaxID=1397368 RepID=A0A4V2FRM0_PSEST|nr:hypothetical protein [Pseudonocardia sediminis]RZT89140.1 hypothetical protein EV383_6099 [Pseudonocardia sediminis]
MSSTTEHRGAGSGGGAHPTEVTAAIAPVTPARHAATPGRSPHAVPPAGSPVPRAYRPAPRGMGPGVPAASAPFRPGPTPGGPDPRRPDAAWAPYALPGGHPAGLGPGYGPPPTAGWGSPQGMRWGWIAIGIVGAILVVAMLGSLASGATMTVPGTVTLASSSTSVTSSSSCSGLGFMSYVDYGAPVTIYDANGTLVGSGSLGSGTPSSSSGYYYYSDCIFSFTLDDVPADSEFYRIKIGSGNGDGVPFSAAQLRSGGAHLTIG